MHGWKKLTGLAAALLCLMLFGPVAHSEQGKPSEPGKANDERGKPKTDEDDVVVKPKGKGDLERKGKSGKSQYGLDWSRKGSPLKEGKTKEFRCDLYRGLYKLEVRVTMADTPVRADAVNFILEDTQFGVTKISDGKYAWYNIGDAPASCKKNQCTEDGVPLEFMDARANAGSIEARLEGKGDWIKVEEVRMQGKECY